MLRCFYRRGVNENHSKKTIKIYSCCNCNNLNIYLIEKIIVTIKQIKNRLPQDGNPRGQLNNSWYDMNSTRFSFVATLVTTYSITIFYVKFQTFLNSFICLGKVFTVNCFYQLYKCWSSGECIQFMYMFLAFFVVC